MRVYSTQGSLANIGLGRRDHNNKSIIFDKEKISNLTHHPKYDQEGLTKDFQHGANPIKLFGSRCTNSLAGKLDQLSIYTSFFNTLKQLCLQIRLSK